MVIDVELPACGAGAATTRRVGAASGMKLAAWVVGNGAVFVAQTAAREAA